MRIRLLGAAAFAAALVLGGCATVGGASPESVPTMTVRATASPTPAEVAPGEEVLPEESADAGEPDVDDQTTAEPRPETPAPSSVPEPTSQPPRALDLGRAPTSYAEAVEYVGLARSRGSQERWEVFRTSDDIYCVLTSPWLDPACELPQGVGVEDSRACANSMGDRVGRVEITARGAVGVCNTDTIRESIPTTIRPVTVVSRGGLECAVAGIGVTCVKTSDRVGFFLGLDSYDTFG